MEMVQLGVLWMVKHVLGPKILATINSELEHADTRCRGKENVEEREQAGASVATKCTLSTVRDG